MGIAEFFSDLYSTMGFPEAHADAPPKDEGDESKDEGDAEDKDEGEGEGKEGGDEKEEGGDEEGGEEGGKEEEEEEEEEEEPSDPKAKLEEECIRSSQCAGYKHHYEECVERVTYQHEHPEQFKGHKEDCVEEFFHLQHCATQCAAPKLFKILK